MISFLRDLVAVRKAASISALIILLFFAAVTFSDYFLSPFQSISSSTTSSSDLDNGKACNIARGEWMHDPDAQPYYTNTTCSFIDNYHNCIKYGKPSLEFLKWRWKPDGCELQRFDPTRFFSIVRGKSILFVGDSLSRSHRQSLECLLSQVQKPKELHTKHFKHMHYNAYNFTISFFWTPFLVRWHLTRLASPPEQEESQSEVFAGPSNLYLDEPDDRWTSAIAKYDYVVISGSHWFMRPTMFYEQGRFVGCYDCNMDNVTSLPAHYSQRMAFRTVLRTLTRLDNFKGQAVLRTVAPKHYENGEWYNGGDCVRTRPFHGDETALVEPEAEFYRAQIEEFRMAHKIGGKKGAQLRLLDVSRIMQLRPDGHPSRYGHWPDEDIGFNVDCQHWCLPGPIDVWNELLLQMLSS